MPRSNIHAHIQSGLVEKRKSVDIACLGRDFMILFDISSSFELFVLSIMQADVHTLRERSCSVCESSVRLGRNDGLTAWPHHLSLT